MGDQAAALANALWAGTMDEQNLFFMFSLLPDLCL